jgi:uncharacterized protein YndB with AHSA1/START domain
MPNSPAAPLEVPDVRRSIVVRATVAQAFRIFTEHPAEWLPAGHTFIREPQSIVMEPHVGGRFYERAADGTEMTRGTITEWQPPRRLAVTWRVGPGWRPVFDDEHASVIIVEFDPAGSDTTEMALTYTHLERHGELAQPLRSAIEASSPDDTLHRYAEVVARHAESGPGRNG